MHQLGMNTRPSMPRSPVNPNCNAGGFGHKETNMLFFGWQGLPRAVVSLSIHLQTKRVQHASSSNRLLELQRASCVCKVSSSSFVTDIHVHDPGDPLRQRYAPATPDDCFNGGGLKL